MKSIFKRTLSQLMVLCMVFCLSTPAFADDTGLVCNCQAGEGSPHLETCPVYVAPVSCDGSVDCAAETHNEGCLKLAPAPLSCDGSATCVAETHNEGCLKLAPAPVSCDGSETCAAETHNEGCLKAIADAAAKAEAEKAAAIKSVQDKIDALNSASTQEDLTAVEAAVSALLAAYPEIGDPNTVLDMSNYYSPMALVENVAQIASTSYATLQAAFEAAQNGDTIMLLNDFSLDTMIINSKNIILDLNGKTITGTDKTEKNFSLIDNRGTLTITGNGKMSLTATVNSGWGRYSAVIANNPGGKLVIESGTIEHLGGTDMAYGIDNLTNGKGTYAETVINGGHIKSTYRGIRQFLNGTEAQNILTINGGTVEGANKSIFFQDPSTNANSGTLIIGKEATLTGDVHLSVTEGSTEWPVQVSIAAEALGSSTVTSKNIPEGIAVENVGGSYGVVNAAKDTVKLSNGKTYASFAEAFNAAKNGDTIILLANNELDSTITNTKNITIDLNGKTLSYSSAVQGDAMITNMGTLIINDSGNGGKIIYTFTGAPDSSYGKGNYTISNCGNLTLNGGTVENATAKMSHASYAIDNNSFNQAASLTINGGSVINTNNYAIRQASSKNNSVSINGGTVSGTRAVWIQLVGSDTAAAPTVSLNVSGGTLIGTGEDGYNLAVYSYSHGNSFESTSINVSGGNFTGDIALGGGKNKTASETVNITGGNLTDVYSYVSDDVAEGNVVVSGGSFTGDSFASYLADDAAFNTSGGTSTVGTSYSVRDSEGNGYSSFNDAIANSDNITLLSDISLSSTININKNLRIDASKGKISRAASFNNSIFALSDGITLTITGMDEIGLDAMRAMVPGLCVRSGSFIIKANHSGGTASCNALAQCSDCGERYGEYAAHTLVYTGQNNVITESCSLCTGHSATATLKAESKYSYTGSEIKNFSITYSSNWSAAKDLTVAYSGSTINPGIVQGTVTKTNTGGVNAVAVNTYTIVRSEYKMWAHTNFYKNSGKPLSFTIETNGDKVSVMTPLSIYTNSGKHVMDVQYFKVVANADGDLVLTIPDYEMKKLGTGRYYLDTALSTNGVHTHDAEAAFRVHYPISTPATGDSANFLLWGGLLAAAGIAIGATLFILKKGKKN